MQNPLLNTCARNTQVESIDMLSVNISDVSVIQLPSIEYLMVSSGSKFTKPTSTFPLKNPGATLNSGSLV